MDSFLFDNGSLQPEPCRQLRCIAKQLSERVGQTITPVSLLHSSTVDPVLLDGKPAMLLETALRDRLAQGKRRFLLQPLFIGPSLALTNYLPQRLGALRKQYPDMQASLASCLVPSEPREQIAVVELLYKNVQTVIQQQQLDQPAVVLVDHGTPVPAVNAVRNQLAAQLASYLGEYISRLAPASMERRPGKAFAFNEPLLSCLLDTPEYCNGPVIVALLFLLPGRHAGQGGDIAEICRVAEMRHPGLQTYCTSPLGEHLGLVPILEQRFYQGLHEFSHAVA